MTGRREYLRRMGFLDRLRGTSSETSVPAGSTMLIGAPADPPPAELVVGLGERCAQHPEVRAAYLFQLMILAEGEEPHLALGVLFDDGADVPPIANDLGARAGELLPEGSYIDVYPLGEAMLEDVSGSVEPIYER